MRSLIAAADGEQYRCLLELLLTAGLRIGESLGLAVCDLDRQHALIRVDYQLGRDGSRTPLKTDESRRALDIPARLSTLDVFPPVITVFALPQPELDLRPATGVEIHPQRHERQPLLLGAAQ